MKYYDIYIDFGKEQPYLFKSNCSESSKLQYLGLVQHAFQYDGGIYWTHDVVLNLNNALSIYAVEVDNNA